MATVDAHAAMEGAATLGVADVTHRRFEQVLWDLLPRGPAWDREDPVMQRLVAAGATELSRVDVHGRKLQQELNPKTTWELLPDWEEMLGLPDCEMPETIEARRAAVMAKLLAQPGHDQGIDYWQSLISAVGYEWQWIATIESTMTCEGDCEDVLYDDEWGFVWSIAVESGIDDDLLACVINHQALIETLPVVHLLWQQIQLDPSDDSVYGIASTTTGYTVAVGSAGLVVVMSIDLASWTIITPPTSDDFFCACAGGMGGELLIAAGAAGLVQWSIDGSSWTAASDATAITATVRGISRSHADDETVVAVGDGGACYRSTDSGDNWSSVASPTAEDLFAVCRCEGALVAVGEDGQILRSTNGGSSWSVVVEADAGAQDLRGVGGWGQTVIAVSSGGGIKRSSDAGLTWDDVESPTSNALFAVSRSTSGRWTACGEQGTLLQSLDDGLTWLVRELSASDDLFAVGSDYPFGRAVAAGAGLLAFVE